MVFDLIPKEDGEQKVRDAVAAGGPETTNWIDFLNIFGLSEILRQPCYVNAEKWQPTEHEASNDDSYRLGSLGFHLKFSNLEN